MTTTTTGVIVEMIEPSIGEVIESAKINNPLRKVVISSAAPMIAKISRRSIRMLLLSGSRSIEMIEIIAAIHITAVKSAIGLIYVGITKLYSGKEHAHARLAKKRHKCAERFFISSTRRKHHAPTQKER